MDSSAIEEGSGVGALMVKLSMTNCVPDPSEANSGVPPNELNVRLASWSKIDQRSGRDPCGRWSDSGVIP
jgi:hypothetical protein